MKNRSPTHPFTLMICMRVLRVHEGTASRGEGGTEGKEFWGFEKHCVLKILKILGLKFLEIYGVTGVGHRRGGSNPLNLKMWSKKSSLIIRESTSLAGAAGLYRDPAQRVPGQ